MESIAKASDSHQKSLTVSLVVMDELGEVRHEIGYVCDVAYDNGCIVTGCVTGLRERFIGRGDFELRNSPNHPFSYKITTGSFRACCYEN